MPSTTVVEMERKFDVKEGAAVPRLKDLPGVARVDEPARQRLDAEYFDTVDLRLARSRSPCAAGPAGATPAGI